MCSGYIDAVSLKGQELDSRHAAINMKRRDFLTAAGAAAAIPIIGSSGAAQAPTLRSGVLSTSFLDKLPQLMEWSNVPGLAVALLKDGKLSWSMGSGVKKAGDPASVNADTLFGAASLSKPLFTYAILRMRDENIIDLDRPLWNYLPYEDLPAAEQSKQITARHVLTHSTGLQNWRFGRGQKLEFAFKPGERFQYSGEGFYYLQRVLESIADRGFEEYMQEKVLKPLGMVNSTFGWTAADLKMSWGHSSRAEAVEAFNVLRGRRHLKLADDWKKPVRSWRHDDAVRANALIDKESPSFPNSLLPNCAGSLITSVNEYALFMARLMQLHRRDEHSLPETGRREMLSPQIKLNTAISWGLGIGLENYSNRSIFWHWGDNGVFKAFMMGDPAAGSGIVVFTNAQNGHRMWQRIVTEAMGPDHPAFFFYMT